MTTQSQTTRGKGAPIGALVLLVIALALLLTMLPPLIYLRALVDGVLTPASSPLTSTPVVRLSSPIALVLLCVLTLLCISGIVLANIHRPRRLLLALGISLLASAVTTQIIALAWTSASDVLGSAWASTLAGTAGSYASWALPVSCIMVALAAVLFSIRVCIGIVERGRA